jgi:hypothetical protein
MFRRFFGQTGDNGATGAFYRPYKNDAVDKVYNLLFCDDPKLLDSENRPDLLGAILSEAPDRESLERIANDLDVESRVRVLAFNRLRAMQVSVPTKRLLGTIIEFPVEGGRDTLAVFLDGSLRYINYTGKLVIFEGSLPTLASGVEEILRTSQFAVNRYGPWTKPRRPPPTGDIARMTFLVSDGLYFGEGRVSDLLNERFAAPVMRAMSLLLPVMVEEALKIDRGEIGPGIRGMTI